MRGHPIASLRNFVASRYHRSALLREDPARAATFLDPVHARKGRMKREARIRTRNRQWSRRQPWPLRPRGTVRLKTSRVVGNSGAHQSAAFALPGVSVHDESVSPTPGLRCAGNHLSRLHVASPKTMEPWASLRPPTVSPVGGQPAERWAAWAAKQRSPSLLTPVPLGYLCAASGRGLLSF